MKDILFLAFQYLRSNKIKTSIMVFSVAIAVFLPLTLSLLVEDYQKELTARAETTPLVAGAQGSRLDLVVQSLYFKGEVSNDLIMGDVDKINESGLALAIPIISKHEARGFPIVGTSFDYFKFRGLFVSEGELLSKIGQCVVGSEVAAKLGLSVGDIIPSDPDNVLDIAGDYPINLRVAGVLAPAGSADDEALFVDFKTAWIILGIIHGHEDVTKADPSKLLSNSGDTITASAAINSYQEITAENLKDVHSHGSSADFPISSIIIVPNDQKSSAILRGRYQSSGEWVQILLPQAVLSETMSLVFRVKQLFDTQSLLLGVSTALLISLVVLLSLRLRRGEMQAMNKIGASKTFLFSLKAVDVVLVTVLGVLIAVALSFVVVSQLGASSAKAKQVSEAGQSAKKTKVAVVNYPLSYMVERIAGPSVDIIYPVPSSEGDPAFWEPSADDIKLYQGADLILFNGADYAKWASAATLPTASQVNTSAAFATTDYIVTKSKGDHKHGGDGEHSHGDYDFNTWLDPKLATQQAKAVLDQLVRLLPLKAKDFTANYRALAQDLKELDAAFTELSKLTTNTKMMASHPVYGYASNTYGWDVKSVHWEPGEMPSAEQLKKFEKIQTTHPATLMLWEGEPHPDALAYLKERAIKVVLFETACNTPEDGDYLSLMKANIERLLRALKQ